MERHAAADAPRLSTPPLPDNVVVNANAKERFVFDRARTTAAVLPFDFIVGPGGGLPMKHVHDRQHETFRCVSGELTVLLDKDERILRPGEVIDLPPGTVHAFANRGAVDAVCAVEYRPAGRNEEWLKVVNAIEARNGKPPGILDIAPFILDVGIFIQGPPRWVQVALFSVLRVVANLLGRKRAGLAAAEAVYGRPFQWR